MSMTATHPGRIVYYDGDRVVAEKDVAEVPESGRFAETREGRVPVVRVVARTAGAERFVREYGPDGTLLRATVMLAAPQQPKKR